VKSIVLAAGAMLLLVPATAHAHSEITSTSPEQGARVRRAPDRVVVRLSQPPSDARIIVTDGCGDNVGRRRVISGSTVKTPISKGAPGRWKVVVKTISSADEHLATDRFVFRVAGRASCGDEATGGDGPPAEERDDRAALRNQGGDGAGEPSSGGGLDPSSPGPVLAVVAAIVAASATGLLIRRRRT
jgi:methionine-rich copper-binding protein CopC